MMVSGYDANLFIHRGKGLSEGEKVGWVRQPGVQSRVCEGGAVLCNE